MKIASFETDPVTGEPVIILEGRFTMGDLVNFLSQMERQTGRMAQGQVVGSIEVISVVSSETYEPRVELQSPAFDHPLQLGPTGAIDLGHALFDAASSSIADATLVSFLREKVKVDQEHMAKILYQFREYRYKLFNEPPQES